MVWVCISATIFMKVLFHREGEKSTAGPPRPSPIKGKGVYWDESAQPGKMCGNLERSALSARLRACHIRRCAMEITVTVGDPLKQQGSALVVGCFENEPDAPFVAELDQALGGCLSALYREGEFTGKLNKTSLIHTLGRTAAERLLLVGLGKRGELSRDRLRQAAGTAVQALRGTGVKRACSVLHLAAGDGEGWLQAAVEGHLLGAYSFDRYKSDPEKNGGVAELTLLVPDAAARKVQNDRQGRPGPSAKRSSLPANWWTSRPTLPPRPFWRRRRWRSPAGTGSTAG